MSQLTAVLHYHSPCTSNVTGEDCVLTPTQLASAHRYLPESRTELAFQCHRDDVLFRDSKLSSDFVQMKKLAAGRPVSPSILQLNLTSFVTATWLASHCRYAVPYGLSASDRTLQRHCMQNIRYKKFIQFIFYFLH